MNRITCISGRKKEGKTTELIREFKEALDVLHCEPDIGFSVHLIKCVLPETPQPANDQLVALYIKKHEIDTELLGAKNKVLFVDNIEDLVSGIKDLVSKSDCHIYIDDPFLLIDKTDIDGDGENFCLVFENIVDKYPNETIENSVDITYTRPRL